MNNEKKSTFKWLDKLKKIKHIEVYIAVIFIAILLIFYLSNFTKTENKNKTTTSNELTVTSYVEQLENNLEEILSNIGGVSNVKVMITLDTTQFSVANSVLDLSSFPEIKGIVITANGVKDTTNKLKVLHAVEAVIEVKSGSIEILSSD